MKAVISIALFVIGFQNLASACTPPSDSSRVTSINNADSTCAGLCTSMGSGCLSYRIDAKPQPYQWTIPSNPSIQVDLHCVLVRPNPGGPGTIESIPFVSGYGSCGSELSHAIANSSIKSVSNSCGLSTETKQGSSIDVNFQSLGEEIPLVGVPFSLLYSTDLVRRRIGLYNASIPVTQTSYSPSATQYRLKVWNEADVLVVDQTYSAGANITYAFSWNGNKANGSESFDPVLYTYRVYESGAVANGYSTVYALKLGTFRSAMIGLGHFLPSMYSYYDSDTNTIFYATGGSRGLGFVPNLSSSVYNIAEPNGDLVNEYHVDGRLKRIRTGLTGQTIYSFTYDGNGFLSSVQDAFSKTTTFNRNVSGVWQSITTPYGKTISVNIDGYGRLEKVTQPSTDYYEMTYIGNSDLMYSFRKPNGAISTFSYDGNGDLTQDSHSGGFVQNLLSTVNTAFERSVEYSHSGKSAVETHTNFISAQKRKVVDSTAPLREVNYSSSSSRVSDSGYDTQVSYSNHPQFGYAKTVSSVTDNSHSRQITYSNSINFSNWSDPFSVSAWTKNSTVNGQITSSVYSPSLGKWTTTTPTGKTSSFSTDVHQRVTQLQQGTLDAVNFNYTNEHLTSVVQGSRTTSLAYSATTGLLESITNPLSQTTRYFYDSNERVSSIENPDLSVTYFAYNSVGQLASITPVSRPNHAFGFNASELISSYTPPVVTGVSSPQTTYTYDDNKIKTITRPDGKVITYNYNSTSALLTSIASTEATINVSLNTANNLPSYLSSTQRPGVRYTYQGRMVTTEQTEEANSTTVGHTYYRNLQPSTGRIDYDYVLDKHNQSGWVMYSYDNDERLSQVGEINLDYYTPSALLDTAKSGSSQDQITKYTYNSYGDALTQTTTVASSQVYKMTLTYDGAGRIKTKKEDIVGLTTPNYDYTYDTLGRVTDVKDGAITIAQYTYDGNGNRLTRVDTSGTTNYAYDNQDRLMSAGVYDYTYNQFGERQSKTNTLTNETTYYVYDSFGNLTSVQLPNGDVISYEIDTNNRRIGKKKNGVLQSRYVYMDGLRIAAELNGSMQLKRRFGYATKSNIPDYYVEAGVKYRIVSDQLGSPRVVFNIANGSVIATMDHNEFGKIVANTNTSLKLPFGFAGGLYDEETGLVRLGARDYDPIVGRWLSKDPIGFAGGDTNLYGYVMSDPVNFVDPQGTFWIQVGAGLFGGIWNGYQNYKDASAVKGAKPLQIFDSTAVGFLTGFGSGVAATFGFGFGVLGNTIAAGVNNYSNQRIFSCEVDRSSIKEAMILGFGSGIVSGAIGQGVGSILGFSSYGQNVIGIPLNIFGLSVTNGIPGK